MPAVGLDLFAKSPRVDLLREGVIECQIARGRRVAARRVRLRGLSERLGRHGARIRAAIESMIGARFVHDRLEMAGWQVEIADAKKVKGLAPLACKTDRIDAWVLAELAR
jgi:hypothetical protein